jgi:aldehyde dehydrogenase (NAD+)
LGKTWFMVAPNIISQLTNKIIIDNHLAQASSSATLEVINPSTAEVLTTIAQCGQQDVDQAVHSSLQAQAHWKGLSANQRGQLVQQAGQCLKEKSEELAWIMSLETGKAIRTESRIELSVIADTFSYFAGLALELKGETIPFSPDMLSMTIREPLGVVGAIIPWNVPLLLMAMKIAPALVAGNTVVLKPSPEATLCVLRAAELINQVLPKGVLNVVTGDGTTGQLLVSHPKIQKVTFTGSVETGRKVYQTAAEKIIPVTLELGGKSPLIIFEDAELDKVVESIYEGMRFTRQGQSCSASTRIFVHESLHDDFVNKLLAILNTKIMGDPMEEATDIGTIISKRQFDKVNHFVSLAKADPALQVHEACQLPKAPHLSKGLFVRPAIVTGVDNDHELCQKEIFGPVVAVIKWSDYNQVIRQANDVEFGLAAGVWTRDLSKALQAVHQLDAGFVQINQYIVFRPSTPFGGFKHSGIGKEASLDSMLEHYTRTKTILINMKG